MLPQGAASVGETYDSQLIAVALELRGNNRHAVSGLSKRQQGMRVSTFEHDCRLQPCHSAGRIKGTTKSESTIHQQQRKAGKTGNLNGATVTKRHRGMANCQQLHRSEREAAVMAFVQLDCMQ